MAFGERLAAIREAGYDATSLWWPDFEDGEWLRLRDAAPEQVRRAGLELDHLHAPYRHANLLWSADADDRRSLTGKYRTWIDDCAHHNVGIMVMHVVGGRAPVELAHGLDSFHRLVEHAAGKAVTLAIENTRQPWMVGWLLERIESPAFGLCFDTGHDRLYSDAPLALLRAHGKRLVATHLSDTDGILDRHWAPGDGVVEFEAVRELLDGYDGVLLAEVVRPREEECEVFLRRCRAQLVAIFAASSREALSRGR